MVVKVKVAPYIDLELAKVNGQLKVLRGILDDGIGWQFLWGDELPQNMLLRIFFSDLWPEFIKEWQTKGLSLEDLKLLLVNYDKEQLESAMYVLTGDNRTWVFGEPFKWLSDCLSDGFAEDLQERYGLDFSQAREIVDKSEFWWEIPTEYSDFKSYFASHNKDWEESYRRAVETSSNFEDLVENLRTLRSELEGEINDEYREKLYSLWTEYLDSPEGEEEIKKLIEEVKNEG